MLLCTVVRICYADAASGVGTARGEEPAPEPADRAARVRVGADITLDVEATRRLIVVRHARALRRPLQRLEGARVTGAARGLGVCDARREVRQQAARRHSRVDGLARLLGGGVGLVPGAHPPILSHIHDCET